MHRPWPYFLLVAAVALTACGATTGSSSSSSSSSGRSGSGVPDFTLSDVNGAEYRMADHVGEGVILINFWATWCGPCRVEMPHLDRLQETYGEAGLEVLCVSMDGPDTVSQVRGHVSRYDYSFTVLLDEESEVTRLYNPRRAAPFNVIVDRTGTIVWSHEGYSPGDEVELEEQIRAALGAEPQES